MQKKKKKKKKKKERKKKALLEYNLFFQCRATLANFNFSLVNLFCFWK